MQIKIDLSALRQTRWYEYVLRFLFGGIITAVAGTIAKKFGPAVGGLFLAFPAIFPASATLIEKHETERKEKLGLNGKARGRAAASVDAAGAAIGSIVLMIFALLVWLLLLRLAPWFVLTLASVVWFALSALFWLIRKRI
ncbi:MAG TPA: DUF3147 family protein [Chthoniobacterales bacterium]|jgi:hypothetical protein